MVIETSHECQLNRNQLNDEAGGVGHSTSRFTNQEASRKASHRRHYSITKKRQNSQINKRSSTKTFKTRTYFSNGDTSKAKRNKCFAKTNKWNGRDEWREMSKSDLTTCADTKEEVAAPIEIPLETASDLKSSSCVMNVPHDEPHAGRDSRIEDVSDYHKVLDDVSEENSN